MSAVASVVVPSVGSIHKLDESVINRIAAGEVVQRPANAIKELIENCIDAKSTNIQITVKDGGLKLLQIQDNGTGIQKDDLDIVCERFTTSKLTNFEDLKSIATFGFRGEALSSISHVAHVTIRTRTADAKCAMQISYTDGKPKGLAKPCAGNQGTIITVEDLFYNVPMRRKVITSPVTEYARIAEVVSRYAVHNAGIGFSLKKHGDTVANIKTMSNSTTADNIKLIYGADVAKELLDISAESQVYKFKLNGYITKFDYGGKKTTLLLFINNRLVECAGIRKAIESVYSAYLNKNTFPFVYLSLHIAPQNVDVNVHPTKEEVLLLHQSDILEEIQKVVESRLMATSHCRTIYVQTLLPTLSTTAERPAKRDEDSSSATPSSVKVYQHNMVRTDSRDRKLDAFFSQRDSSADNLLIKESGDVDRSGVAEKTANDNRPIPGNPSTISREKEPVRQRTRLQSVLSLCEAIKQACSPALKDIFHNHTFVGCVTPALSLVQHQTNLYLLNISKLSEQFFYQLMLQDFGMFGVLRLSSPAPIYELALLAMETIDHNWSQESETRETLAKSVAELLRSKSEMLQEYFSMEVDDEGNLRSLPYLLEKYVPNMDGLPMYVLRLSTEVNWDDEKDCFDTFCRETSKFYAFSVSDSPGESAIKDVGGELPSSDSSGASKVVVAETEPPWKFTVEHVLFPAFRASFQPRKDDSENGHILKVANLHDLYQVFERC